MCKHQSQEVKPDAELKLRAMNIQQALLPASYYTVCFGIDTANRFSVCVCMCRFAVRCSIDSIAPLNIVKHCLLCCSAYLIVEWCLVCSGLVHLLHGYRNYLLYKAGQACEKDAHSAS